MICITVCILLFDELDSLAMNREQDSSSTILLNEMVRITNAGSSQGVSVVAATNRLCCVQGSLKSISSYRTSYPESSSVLEILLMMRTAKMPLNESVNLLKWSDVFSKASSSCAEVEGVCRDACLIAMRRCSDETDLRSWYAINYRFRF
jgi:ATP-dependent 26S proteasome regulatory subunit